MSDKQTCPYCGAAVWTDVPTITRFHCYVAKFNDGRMGSRTSNCYERQLAAKDAEIERLKQALNSLLEVEELVCRFDHNGNCQSHYLDPAINGCRVAKARKLL